MTSWLLDTPLLNGPFNKNCGQRSGENHLFLIHMSDLKMTVTKMSETKTVFMSFLVSQQTIISNKERPDWPSSFSKIFYLQSEAFYAVFFNNKQD